MEIMAFSDNCQIICRVWKSFRTFAQRQQCRPLNYKPMDKSFRLPAVAWLRVADYQHSWLQRELGGELRIKDQRVISIQHLQGAREVFRMETFNDTEQTRHVCNAMSATRRNIIETGISIDPETTERLFGVTKENIGFFLPIECPKMCMNANGVLRPWAPETCFGKQQASELQLLLRREFWKAVADFDAAFAKESGGKRYPIARMIEAFCVQTRTPDLYVEAMRREWQRIVQKGRKHHAAKKLM